MRPDASQKLAAVAPKKGPNKAIIAAILAIVLLAVAFSAYFITQRGNSEANTAATQPGQIPKGATSGGKGFTVYPEKAKSGVNTVDVYEDFQCPYCKQMEQSAGKKLEELAKDGKIKLNYHVLSFLDNGLKNDASARSANAAFCAADQGKFLEFHNKVFANQPAKEGEGYTDDQLKGWGKDVGLSEAQAKVFNKCVDDNHYSNYVKATNDTMGTDKVTGTPTIKVNGEDLSNSETNSLLEGSDPTDIVTKK